MCTIAQDLLETARKNASIDWAAKENVLATMRVTVGLISRTHG